MRQSGLNSPGAHWKRWTGFRKKTFRK